MDAKFKLGRLVATPGAIEALSEACIRASLARHVIGDWGDVDAHDCRANDTALKEGSRLLSVYHDDNKLKFWIITEWDRSTTTVLLPDEY